MTLHTLKISESRKLLDTVNCFTMTHASDLQPHSVHVDKTTDSD